MLRIGVPWRGRLFLGSSGTPQRPAQPSDASFIPVLRRLSAGTENLWLLAINPDYFINHFDQLLDSHIGHVQLLRYDACCCSPPARMMRRPAMVLPVKSRRVCARSSMAIFAQKLCPADSRY